MKKLLIALAFSVRAFAGVQPGYVEGEQLATIRYVDDSGAVRSTEQWRGLPAIIAPIYTRCPLACPLITEGLKKAVAGGEMRTGTYRVILFSFDPRDTPADLRRFRERHRVPLDWTVATADATSIRALMDSIGFHYAQTNNAFTHPNVVIGITPELKTSGFLFGTSYRSSDVERLLSRSSSARLIDRYAAAIFGLLLFACVMSLVYLVALTRDLPKSRAVQMK